MGGGSPPPALRARRLQQSTSADAADGPMDGPVVPKSRRRLAALADQEKKKQPRKRKAAEIARDVATTEEVPPSSGAGTPTTSNGMGSAISAPDWPPVNPSPASSDGEAAPVVKKGAKGKQRAASGGRTADAGAVRDFLRAGTKPTLGLESWEDTDISEKRQHDRLLQRAAPKRKKVDEYDEEYDRGKVKKVKNRERGSWNLDSSTFDAAFKSQKANGIGEVQLRGKKKKMAERGAAARKQQQGGGRGRGRGQGRK